MRARDHDHEPEKIRARAMRQLHERVGKAYDALVDKLFSELLRFVAKDILEGRLRKSNGFVDEIAWPDMVGFASAPEGARRQAAERKLALLTPAQLEALKAIVRDYHHAFAVGVLGPDAIPGADLQRLIAMGITPSDFTTIFVTRDGEKAAPAAVRLLDHAYQYGRLTSEPEGREMHAEQSLDDFLAHLAKTRDTLTEVDRQAMGAARYQAGQYMRGMGDRLALEIGALVLDADAEQRRKYLGTVQRELEDSIDRQGAWRELASDIGHATEDWSRDMQRVAATEQQWAIQEGLARAMAKGRSPKDIRVAKIPSPTACPDCVRLHLTGGPGSPPRVFKLSELVANGTNVGLKRNAWRPTVGPVHPWCACELVEVPDGWAFDPDTGEMVPEVLLRKADRLMLAHDALRKAEGPHLTYRAIVPENGVVIRIADPMQRQVAESVVADAPAWLFRKDTGVTLITTDHPRAQNPLEEHDYAYWTANEIRVNPALPIERWPRVLRHELGHALNVYLMRTLGGPEPVRKWHDQLWEVSEREGWVSPYAKKLPIENAAEVTRMYLFDRSRLMLGYPRQFAFVHRAYRGAQGGPP